MEKEEGEEIEGERKEKVPGDPEDLGEGEEGEEKAG